MNRQQMIDLVKRQLKTNWIKYKEKKIDAKEFSRRNEIAFKYLSK